MMPKNEKYEKLVSLHEINLNNKITYESNKWTIIL